MLQVALASFAEFPFPQPLHTVLDLSKPVTARRTDCRGVSHLLPILTALWVCQGERYSSVLSVGSGGGRRRPGCPPQSRNTW